jgi:hypothetical protein
MRNSTQLGRSEFGAKPAATAFAGSNPSLQGLMRSNTYRPVFSVKAREDAALITHT